MLGSSGLPVFPIDAESGRGIDVSRHGTTFRFDIDDHAIVTGGSGSLFTISTEPGDAALKRGLGFLVQANRDFTGAPRIEVDDAVAKPWLDIEGQPLARVIKGRLYRVVYDPIVDAFRSDSPVLIANDDLVEAPEGTIKGNAGDGNADLTGEEVRLLIELDHVANKSEAEMVAAGPISDALAEKATNSDLSKTRSDLVKSIAEKASLADIAAAVDPLDDRVDNIERAQSSNRITRGTWAEIAPLVPSATTTYEVLVGDTGRHAGITSEFGYDAATGTVPNPGVYAALGNPLAIRRIGPPGSTAAAIEVGKSIVTTTLPLSDQFGLVLKNLTTGELADLTHPDSILWIQEVALADRFPFDFNASGEFGKAPVDAVAQPLDGAGIGRLSFKNQSETAYATIAFGKDAEHLGSGSDTYAPGAGYTYDPPPSGRVSVVTNGDAVPVTLRFWRSINKDPNSPARAAKHLARYGGGMSDARRAGIGDFYLGLLESGWIDMCAKGGSIWVGRAPNNFDGLIDWAHPDRTFGRVVINSSTPPDTSFAGTVFNGNNAIDTLVTPTTTSVNKHSLFVAADQADAGSAKVATGNSGIRVAPNRTGTVTTLYTGGGSLLVTAGGRGGLQGYTRSNNAGIRFYKDGTLKSDIAEVADDATLGSGSIYIGGLHALSGLTFGYTGTLEFQAQTYDAVPTDAQVDKLVSLLATFRTAVGG
ncbi:hypothetical protein [Methylobacterium sp. E-045]|uniref:hypothetical protein n=1 Tax=Methylobacterium sp. E-045 TaxID=2836575 RepID=UPI001FB90D1B|nr:hypothetical protein [Methylobacterium sp. E-045]MCJ2129212.1 hypothetical protein [Methylobacterium sp. E-045]